MLRLLVLMFCLAAAGCSAAFDLTPYQIPASDTIRIPDEILYPQYFRETDEVTFENIIAEFRSRFQFFSGLRSDSSERICYKMQRRINKGLERLVASAGQLPFNSIDDQMIFDDESPLSPFLRPMPVKHSEYCSFKSFGDLKNGGTVYCAYHGIDVGSSFYKTHLHEFEVARPAFTAFDLVELLIFFPALLVIPVTWLVLKKALENKPPPESNKQG